MMNNQADFELLGRSTQTVESICEKSRGVGKLVKTCQSFYQIACSHHEQLHSQKLPSQQSPRIPSILPGAVGVPDPMLAIQDAFEINPSTFDNVEFSMQEDWDQMLDGWELGLGAESARQMTSYLEQYPAMGDFVGPS